MPTASSDLTPKPNGNIVVTNATSGAHSYDDGGNALHRERRRIYDRYYGELLSPVRITLTVVNWTAPFNIPCFAPHYVDAAQKTNIVQFIAVNATPVSDHHATKPVQCVSTLNGALQYDEETVRITDNDGHVVNFYYRQ